MRNQYAVAWNASPFTCLKGCIGQINVNCLMLQLRILPRYTIFWKSKADSLKII